MLKQRLIINADFKGQTIEEGIHIKVQVRESFKTIIVKAFISAVMLRVVKHMVNGILEDIEKTDLKLKKRKIYDVEA